MPKQQLRQNLKQKTALRQRLHANLVQAIHLLSLPQHELREEIMELIAENPFVEEISAGDTPPWLKDDVPEFVAKSHVGLQENLLLQLVDMDMPERIFELARIIISSLDDSGFTVFPHRTIIAENRFSAQELRACIGYLKQLEPCGVGAENIWQSLRWQAEMRFGKDTLLLDLIDILANARQELGRFNQVEKNSLCEILGISLDVLEEKLRLLATLDPHPVNRADGSAAEWAIPEIFFSVRDGQIHVQVSEQYLPRFRINHELYHKMEGKKEGEWQQLYHKAKTTAEAIKLRSDTLLQVARLIAQRQYEFFTRGTAYIKTMNLRDLAEGTGRHISTVSRILSRKYFHCHWGIFPLRLFLVRGVRATDGAVRSAEELKAALLALLAEDKERKKSDREIAELLAQQGFAIRRRTVNKYRRLLFQDSTRKKRHGDPF
ncbi:MAG: hypothetical protein N2Z22_04400 [Turneriella sp.]|nr:hypothetical protein [Turneriella sp.]